MALTKKVYVDNETVIPASNLNAIQDEIIANAAAISGKAPTAHTHTKSQITDFPTSMPASDVYTWAKASTKPTYTASEVGAAPTSHTHTKSQITDLVDYTLPTASATTLGGVKVGDGLTIGTDGTLSAQGGGEPDAYIKSASVSGNTLTLVNKDDSTTIFIPTEGGGGSAESVDWANVYNKPSTFTPSAHTHTKSQITDLVDYTLPAATTSTLGGVKIGDGLSITDDGTLSAQSGSSVTVDDTLSTTSENPVQNKVITAALDSKAPQYIYSTVDLTPNVSSLDTGKLYIVYE